jgi:hypothetical protein
MGSPRCRLDDLGSPYNPSMATCPRPGVHRTIGHRRYGLSWVSIWSRVRARATRGSPRGFRLGGGWYCGAVPGDAALMTVVQAIARGAHGRVSGLLAAAPDLVVTRLGGGDLRSVEECFLAEIDHQMYAGDTALHIAAAAYEGGIVRELVDAGATVAAANRRGAQPLHYAVDGNPGSARWNPAAQEDTVRCLLELGADPTAADKNGTTALHRAVRNRCAAAVVALLDAGADPQVTNGRGSTALQLARWTTGRGGSGSAQARAQQREILRLLQPSGGV